MKQQISSIFHKKCTGLGEGGVQDPPPPLPSTFSMGIIQNSQVRNSGIQANAVKLEISSKYIIQYIVGENQVIQQC